MGHEGKGLMDLRQQFLEFQAFASWALVRHGLESVRFGKFMQPLNQASQRGCMNFPNLTIPEHVWFLFNVPACIYPTMTVCRRWRWFWRAFFGSAKGRRICELDKAEPFALGCHISAIRVVQISKKKLIWLSGSPFFANSQLLQNDQVGSSPLHWSDMDGLHFTRSELEDTTSDTTIWFWDYLLNKDVCNGYCIKWL